MKISETEKDGSRGTGLGLRNFQSWKVSILETSKNLLEVSKPLFGGFGSFLRERESFHIFPSIL